MFFYSIFVLYHVLTYHILLNALIYSTSLYFSVWYAWCIQRCDDFARV